MEGKCGKKTWKGNQKKKWKKSKKKIKIFIFFFNFDLVCVIDKEAEMTATDGDVWTVQVLSAEGPVYNWPYGTRALIAERKRVLEIESLRHLFEYGKMVNPYTHDCIFTFPMSFKDSYVHSDVERIALIHRMHTYYNFNWKCDATARARLGNGLNEELFRALKREADELLAKRIEDVLLLQGLTEELKPETLELANRCTSFQKLFRCMLDAKNEST